MSLQAYTLTVSLKDLGLEPASSITVKAVSTKADYTSEGVLLPLSKEVDSDENGIAELSLASNLDGTQNSRYKISILDKRKEKTVIELVTVTIQMPRANTTLSALVDSVDVSPEATVSVGDTTTGAPGTQATVSNSGTNLNAVFEFTIPQGAKGDKGDKGDQGEPGGPHYGGADHRRHSAHPGAC